MIVWRRYVRTVRRLEKTGVERLAEAKMAERRAPALRAVSSGDIVVRAVREDAIAPASGIALPRELTPTTPHNFTPLRPIRAGFGPVDRAARETPWESRFDILKRRRLPRYMEEGRGTPARQYMEGVVGGIRVRPVFNPYVRLTRQKRYRLDTFASRDWRHWRPDKVYIRGSRQQFELPADITPQKDELGEWHPPRVSGRYAADIEKQFYCNSLPWIWKKDFYDPPLHYMDREPNGPKRWYRKEYRLAAVREAMRGMDRLRDAYRRERREAKRLSWFETTVNETVGDALTAPYFRKRKLPKL